MAFCCGRLCGAAGTAAAAALGIAVASCRFLFTDAKLKGSAWLSERLQLEPIRLKFSPMLLLLRIRNCRSLTSSCKLEDAERFFFFFFFGLGTVLFCSVNAAMD
jgi:hypothetical protein